MAKNFLLSLLAFITLSATTVMADQGPMVLWYDQPAEKWTEALPIGNGRFGAMVFGGTDAERIQFNDDTLWVGEPHDYSHDGAAEYLPAIRKLLFEDKQSDAQKLAGEHFMSVPLRQIPYQPFGDLTLTFAGHDEATAYRRELNIDRAVSTVSYKVGGVTFTRETIASHPDDLIAVRITADKKGQVTFDVNLLSPHKQTTVRAVGNDTLALAGGVAPFESRQMNLAINGAIKFEAQVKVVAEGGRVTVGDEGIAVEGADAATLLLVGATNYVDFEDVSGNPKRRCVEKLARVGKKVYEAIRSEHVADHQKLFRRVTLDLGTTDAVDRPTDERLKAFDENDPQLAALYFQFGRYLMIACSRPGSQPSNLQGLWN
ncbi:MAG TPA: glycoside hydrolase family 95 protein, partial [Thermoguttaceae bacterium]|nr:glycoside hydrolase family 95 protein [Thermoguttaceae bacterium]